MTGDDDATRPDTCERPSHPESVGPFKILDLLGEGGMGTVYAAEQTEPVRRRVALKVIKLGMDSKEVLARFEVERQALAVMDHPGITRVLDVGTTQDGRPWVAMELVHGLPFTEYCDHARLSTRDRLELFQDVCHAVQHAHQKGIVHRDLKPSNILVTEHDSKPAAKIIDFGIAKALGQSLTDKTLVTRLGQSIGTPTYMSPEQAEGSGLDIDTRTDVHALGVPVRAADRSLAPRGDGLSGGLPLEGRVRSGRTADAFVADRHARRRHQQGSSSSPAHDHGSSAQATPGRSGLDRAESDRAGSQPTRRRS